EHGVQTGDVVPFRGDVDVAVRVVEAELGGVQLQEEQMDDDVHRAEARAEVTGAGALDGDERIRPAHVRNQGEILLRTGELALRDQLHGCFRSTSSSTSTPQPGPAGIVSTPFSICGAAVVSVSRHGTSSTSTSRMRT